MKKKKSFLSFGFSSFVVLLANKQAAEKRRESHGACSTHSGWHSGRRESRWRCYNPAQQLWTTPKWKIAGDSCALLRYERKRRGNTQVLSFVFPNRKGNNIRHDTTHRKKYRSVRTNTGFDALLAAAAGRDWSRSRTEVISRVVTTRYISRSSVCAVLCGPASYIGGPYTTSIVNTAERRLRLCPATFLFSSLSSPAGVE